MGSSRNSPIIVISDDEEELAVPVPAAVATVVVLDPEQEQPVAAADGPVDGVDEDVERPSWLPDGFEMEGNYLEDGKFQATSYICPASGFSFRTESEVLEYCFSGALERAAKAEATLNDETKLQGKYAWLRGKHGWLIEIRTGKGESKNKMFKFFAHPRDRVRLASKDEVIRYIDHAERPEPANGDCDTSNDSNIIAQLEFSIKSLPPGWVKETVFRRNKDGTSRRSQALYTDPISEKVFRSLKAAEQCFATGEPLDGRDPVTSVTEMYSFDWCTDMLPCLARRLENGRTEYKKNDRREDWKYMLHDDEKEEHHEEEWHGDDKKKEYKEAVVYGDGNDDEDGKEAISGDGMEEEGDEQEDLYGGGKEEDDEQADLHGGSEEEDDDQEDLHSGGEEEDDDQVDLHSGGEEEDDEQGDLHGGGEEEDDEHEDIYGGDSEEEMMILNNYEEDDEGHDNYRSIVEIYQVTTQFVETNLKGKKK